MGDGAFDGAFITRVMRNVHVPERRQHQRVRANLSAILCSSNGDYPAFLTDLSEGGCGLKGLSNGALDQDVLILIAGLGRIPARIRWVKSRRVGVEFLMTPPFEAPPSA